MNVTRYRSGGASPDKPYRYDEITGNAYMPIRASTIQRTVDSHACARTCNVTAVAIEDLPRIFVVTDGGLCAAEVARGFRYGTGQNDLAKRRELLEIQRSGLREATFVGTSRLNHSHKKNLLIQKY